MDPLKEEKMRKGQYDICDFIPDLKKGFENAPDYKGPIEVVHVGKKGRGIRATEDIANEEIILVSRAFVYGPNEATEETLIKDVALKMNQEPRHILEVYNLHAGNKFGHQLKSKELEPINLERVRQILRINMFAGHNSKGLWILPSFFNHNCIDFNCWWVSSKQFMFLRATRPIKKGEELLIPYTNTANTYCHRLNFFEAHEFICECRLCLHQSQHLSREERKTEILEIVENMPKKWDAVGIWEDIELLDIYVQEFEGIGLACGKPEWNFSIRPLLEKLFELYEQLEVNEETIKAQTQIAYKYYRVLTECSQNEGGKVLWLGAGYYMARVCAKTQDWEGLRKWIGIVKKEFRVIFGESEDGFKICYFELYSIAIEHGIKC